MQKSLEVTRWHACLKERRVERAQHGGRWDTVPGLDTVIWSCGESMWTTPETAFFHSAHIDWSITFVHCNDEMRAESKIESQIQGVWSYRKGLLSKAGCHRSRPILSLTKEDDVLNIKTIPNIVLNIVLYVSYLIHSLQKLPLGLSQMGSTQMYLSIHMIAPSLWT